MKKQEYRHNDTVRFCSGHNFRKQGENYCIELVNKCLVNFFLNKLSIQFC